MQKQKLTIIIRVLLYSLIVLIPVFFSVAFYSPFAAAKLLLFRIITLAILFLWGLKIFLEKKITFHPSKIYIPLGFFAVSFILSTIFSLNINTSLFGMETRYLGLFTWLNFLLLLVFIHQFITTTKQLKFVLNLGFITAVLLAVFGIMQFFGKADFGIQWSQSAQDRVFGTIGHSNHFGAYLGMFFVMGIPLLVESFRKKHYDKIIALIVSLGLLSATIALTGSRGALVATILASVLVIAIFLPKKIISKKTNHAFRKIILLLLSIILIVTLIAGQAGVFKRIGNSFQDLQNGYIPDRISWWQSAITMAKDRPLFGFGVSTFNDFYNQYRRLDYRVPSDLQDQISPESSHNDYLDLLVNQGIFGLLSYLFLVGMVLYPLLKNAYLQKNIDEKSIIGIALIGGISTYLVQVIVNFGVIDTLSIYFFLLGLSVSLQGIYKKSNEKIIPLTFSSGIIVTIIFSLIVTVGSIFTYHEAAADIAYASAYRNSFNNLVEANQHFTAATSLQPYRYEYYQAAGLALLNSVRNDYDEISEIKIQSLNLAADQYKNAILLNPEHPSVWYQYALVYFELAKLTNNAKDLENGLSALKMAVAKSPNNPIYLYQTAKVYLDLGEKNTAQKLFEQVQKIRPNYQDTTTQLFNIATTPNLPPTP